jgi:hypothetical protein
MTYNTLLLNFINQDIHYITSLSTCLRIGNLSENSERIQVIRHKKEAQGNCLLWNREPVRKPALKLIWFKFWQCEPWTSALEGGASAIEQTRPPLPASRLTFKKLLRKMHTDLSYTKWNYSSKTTSQRRQWFIIRRLFWWFHAHKKNYSRLLCFESHNCTELEDKRGGKLFVEPGNVKKEQSLPVI